MRSVGGGKLRSMRRFEVYSLIVFFIILSFALSFSLILNLPHISQILILIDFLVALIVAIYGSLSIRQEEEEK